LPTAIEALTLNKMRHHRPDQALCGLPDAAEDVAAANEIAAIAAVTGMTTCQIRP